MSTLALAFSLLSLVGASVALPTSAVVVPRDRGVSNTIAETQFCKDLVEEGGVPWLSVGECIALNNSTDEERHNWWVHVCHNWRDEGLLDDLNYSSFSQCVHDYAD